MEFFIMGLFIIGLLIMGLLIMGLSITKKYIQETQKWNIKRDPYSSTKKMEKKQKLWEVPL